MSTPSDADEAPYLLHLTRALNDLAAILRQGAVRAIHPFGAAHNHGELGPSQRVACFSALPLAEAGRLAARRGALGLSFNREPTQAAGAAPVLVSAAGQHGSAGVA